MPGEAAEAVAAGAAAVAEAVVDAVVAVAAVTRSRGQQTSLMQKWIHTS